MNRLKLLGLSLVAPFGVTPPGLNMPLTPVKKNWPPKVAQLQLELLDPL